MMILTKKTVLIISATVALAGCEKSLGEHTILRNEGGAQMASNFGRSTMVNHLSHTASGAQPQQAGQRMDGRYANVIYTDQIENGAQPAGRLSAATGITGVKGGGGGG